MKIELKEIERIEDPTGILSGARDEVHFVVRFEDEEDELYRAGGIGVRLLVHVEEQTILAHFIYETADGAILEYELDEDELKALYEHYIQNK